MHQGKHTIDDIQERTSLPRHFIHRCSSKLSDLLDPYRQYGDKNRLFYDDNGLMIFDHISQLKGEGKNIPEIRETLENELQSSQNSSKSDRNTLQHTPQNSQNKRPATTPGAGEQKPWIAALQEAYQEFASAKDEVIESKEETISSLRQNLKLITDGRDPKEVKREHEKKIKEAAEKEQKIKELKKKEQRRRKREKKRQQLLAELRSLEGKWFKSGRRREIIAELERLDRLDAEDDHAEEEGS